MPGDVLEAGAWKGGASIFIKGVLKTLGADRQRKVLLADSFQGFPAAADGHDSDGWKQQNSGFTVRGGAAAVQKTFQRYGLLDSNVVFIQGFFNETLPMAAREGHLARLALLRLDCDMYQSTMDVLEATYHRLSPGGIVVHNNWQYTAARAAAVDFRRRLGIETSHPVHLIDMGSAFWVA